jgi:hypothetical protein
LKRTNKKDLTSGYQSCFFILSKYFIRRNPVSALTYSPLAGLEEVVKDTP